MSLVAYDYSDDEGSEENNETESNVGKVLLPEITKDDNTELFSALPTPKYNSQTVVEEDDDEFLKKTAQKTEKPKPNTVKISIPSLSEFRETETDADEVPRKIFKPSAKLATTGLFAVLPPPKTAVKAPTTKFVPNSVTKKPLIPQKVVQQNQETIIKDDDLEDSKQTSNSYFFTSIFDDIKNMEPPTETAKPVINIDSAKNIDPANLKTNKFFSEMVNSTNNVPIVEEPVIETEENTLVKEAYSQLVGKSRRAKGKGKGKARPEMEIIDINAADIMPDEREWMTKTLTEEQPTSSVNKEEEPSLQQRRKHQITYLAYQAKLNEQELKNQWANNRMSRKQTQAKYGF